MRWVRVGLEGIGGRGVDHEGRGRKPRKSRGEMKREVRWRVGTTMSKTAKRV